MSVDLQLYSFAENESSYPFAGIEAIRVRGSSRLQEEGAVTWNPQERTVDFRPVGRWQQWPRHRKWLFKRIAGEMLIRLGYAEDMDW